MSWILVFLAGLLEVFWPLGLKYSDTVLEWIATIIIVVLSFALLIKAYEKLPAGTVYAVFTGMGTIGIFLIDTIFLGTPASIQKVMFFSLIVVGVIGLKLVSPDDSAEKSSDSISEKEGR